ncbi:MAG: choice-of-anchor J domain-containing protein, partial [Bacteroidales bacterium]
TLSTPLLDLTKLKNPMLSFYYKNEASVESYAVKSDLIVLGTTNGSEYTQIAKMPVNTSNLWALQSAHLDPAFTGIKIAISTRNRQADGKPTFLDDIYVGPIPDTLCMLPKNVRITDTTSNSITLQWESYGAATQWQIQQDMAPMGAEFMNKAQIKTLVSNAKTMQINGLIDTIYHFKIRATCPTDTSNWSSTVSVQIPVSCPKPVQFKALDITNQALKLDWSPIANEKQYIIEIVNASTVLQKVLVSDTTYQVTHLEANMPYEIRLSAYCGLADTSRSIILNVKTACNLLLENELPWSTDFEGINEVNQFPDCMGFTTDESNVTNHPVGTFITENATCFAHSGTKAARFVATEGNHLKNDDYLWTPGFTLKKGHTYRLSFWLALAKMSEKNIYSIETRVGLAQTKEAMMLRIGDSISLKDSTTTYRKYSVEYTPESNADFYFGIHALTPDFGATGLNIDDISLERVLTCQGPLSIIMDTVMANSAQLSWEKNVAPQCEIRYGKVNLDGFSEAEQQITMVNTNTITLSNLLPETQYGFQIRTICAEGDTSAWTLIQKFTTMPICPNPTQIKLSEQSANSFKLSWTSVGTESQWDLSIVEGRQTDTALMPYIKSTDKMYTFTNLKANRYYTVHLRAYCSTKDQSDWIKIDTISTLCGIETMPYDESFESIVKHDELPLCMQSSNTFNVRTRITTDTADVLRARTGTKFVYFLAASNDWLYTPAFDLKAGQEYEFSAYWTSEETINRISLNYGNERTNTMTELVKTEGQKSKKQFTQIKSRFTPSVNGIYYFAVYVQSGNGIVSVDDLN